MSAETTVRSTRAPKTDNATRGGLAVGTNVGRYVVLAVAGEGGFGVVYRAYDPELDRAVALKVLDARSDDDPARRRLVLTEARALAKLRHPNIVTVYDVGEHDGRGFVAMEYVDGIDLAAWIAERSPSPSERARVMAQAARGLAAAHEAGIVHRDFKPSNVLVDRDGAVFVADFGLARVVVRSDGGLEPSGDAEARALPPGTPKYLAPELYDGESASARSDLYAFCVALWEVAFGEPPWPDAEETEQLAAKRKGLGPTPERHVLTREAVALLRAGLSADPEARPPSLGVLADALQGDRGRRRWGLAALAVLALVAAFAYAIKRDDPCAEVNASLQPVWDEPAQQAVHEAIEGSDVAHPDESWERLRLGVDAWTERWQAERTEACRATHVRRERSEATLDERMACLDRELSQLSTVLELVRDGDRELIGQAPRAVAKLRGGLSCDRELLERTQPERADLIADLDRAQVLEVLAQYDVGLALAEEVEGRAETRGADDLRLRARYRRARLLALEGHSAEAVEIHEQIHWDAEASSLDDIAASAGLDVMFEYAANLDQPEATLSWAPHVLAAIRRAGDDDRRHASWLDARGIAELYTHDVEAALASHLEALPLREAYDETGLDTVATLQNIGIALEELHRYDEAIEHQRRALEILQRELGEHHPHTARAADNLGTALLRNGDIAAASELFSRALEIRRATFGPEHRSVALSTLHLAHAALMADDPQRAIARFDEALAIYTKVLPAGAREIMLCEEGLAHAYQAVGDREHARAHANTALAGLSDLPPDHPEIAGLRAIVDAP